MWTRALLKENGKKSFMRNYWTCVLASVIIGFLAGGGSGLNMNFTQKGNTQQTQQQLPQLTAEELQYMTLLLPVIVGVFIVAFAITFAMLSFVTNVFEVGGNRYYIENREHKTDVSRILWGFQNNYMGIVKVQFFRLLYTFGWSLLFIIPGIVKGYSYSMIPYLLAENPNLSKDRAFQISMQMMEGHKMEFFVLQLSFIGWAFLNTFTFGFLGIFYVNPYMHATNAEFYSALKVEALQKGITNTEELPGVSIEPQMF